MGIDYAAQYEKMFGKKPGGPKLTTPEPRSISPFFGGQTQGLGGGARPYYGPGGAGDGSGKGQVQRSNPSFREAIGLPPLTPDPVATPAPATPTPTGNGGGRNEQRTNAKGVEQTGTNTGAINMPGLEDVDMTGIANFAGPSFPTQPSTNKLSVNYANNNSGFNIEDGTSLGISPDAYQPQAFSVGEGKVPSFSSAMQAGEGNVPASFSADNYKMGGKFTGPPTPTQGLDQTPGKSGPIDEDMEFGTSNPMGYALDGEEMRRRSAFLDAPDSMQGMQNVAAGLGMGNQGIRNYANVNGEAVEMSQEERRGILNAAPGKAQALKDDFINRINATKSEEDVAQSTPDTLQSPGVVGEVEGINSKMNVGKDKNKLNAGSFVSGGLDIPGISNTQGVSPAKFDASKFYLK